MTTNNTHTRDEWFKSVIENLSLNSQYNFNEAECIVNSYPDYIKLCKYHKDGKTAKSISKWLLKELEKQND